ncbi:MAG: hypothetical protein MZV64_18275 [Ignavibacteriales bacterium]|nr:hypothetical protein [Ignavibacteriales bacterium]
MATTMSASRQAADGPARWSRPCHVVEPVEDVAGELLLEVGAEEPPPLPFVVGRPGIDEAWPS